MEPPPPKKARTVTLTTVAGTGVEEGVNLDDGEGLRDLMDGEDDHFAVESATPRQGGPFDDRSS